MKSLTFDAQGYSEAISNNKYSEDEVETKLYMLLFLTKKFNTSFVRQAHMFGPNEQISTSINEFWNEMNRIEKYITSQIPYSADNDKVFEKSKKYKEINNKYHKLYTQTEKLTEYLNSKNKYVIIISILNPRSHLKSIVRDIFASII